MRRLIVNADDFGLTQGVNRAVIELHAQGILTSATLMARAAASDDAIHQALKNPSLGIGCHIVLVDGVPILPATEIPTLVDRATGRFHSSLGAFLRRLLTGRIDHSQIQAEVLAQILAIRDRGIHLTHVDTHKHTHMFPAVLRPVLRAAHQAVIPAVRNPFEPLWSRRATVPAPWTRRLEVSVLHRLATRFRRIVESEGMVTTDGTIGVLATGTLNVSTLTSLLKDVPEGVWELVTHPGYRDADLSQVKTRLQASREVEREALLMVRKPVALELVSFAELGKVRTLGY